MFDRKKWDEEHKKEHNQNALRSYHKLRLTALRMIGNKCQNCGCNDEKLLEINHINGGGRKEFLKINGGYTGGTNFYRAIVKGKRTLEDLNVLCRVCQWNHERGLKDLTLVGAWQIKWIGRQI